ncbi:MAG: KTSC domain-containing protein [Phycisphaerae bacterium]
MNRISVQSSNIRSIGYDTDKRILEVEFNSGSIYQYSGVSEYEYEGLLNASSKGRYMNTHIKDRFTCIQVR